MGVASTNTSARNLISPASAMRANFSSIGPRRRRSIRKISCAPQPILKKNHDVRDQRIALQSLWPIKHGRADQSGNIERGKQWIGIVQLAAADAIVDYLLNQPRELP